MTATLFTAISATTGEVLFAGTTYDVDSLEAPDRVLCIGHAFPTATPGWVDEANVYHQRPEAPGPFYYWDWALKAWVPTPLPEPTPEMVRAKRQRLLSASDWTQVLDAPLTQAQRDVWNAYRQELRDITDQPGFPHVVWPTPP